MMVGYQRKAGILCQGPGVMSARLHLKTRNGQSGNFCAARDVKTKVRATSAGTGKQEENDESELELEVFCHSSFC